MCVCVCVCVCWRDAHRRHKGLSSQTGTYTWCVRLLRSPKEAIAAAMQSWRERCEKFVCLQGDYVEK